MRIAFLLLMAVAFAAGESSSESTSAKLIEAIEYEPCDYYCGPLNHPTTAYCIETDGQTMVGEHAGFLWFGESDTKSMRDLVGKQVTIRFDQSSIWMSDNGQRTIKIKRGSNYEQFQNTRCLIEVHRPKLAIAARAEHPAEVPADAFPLAGRQDGNLQNRSLFVWFLCNIGGTGTIDCMKWYPKGDSNGVERYCPRTVDGAPVGPGFQIDHLASREGRLVLTSGAVLLFDHRGRTNEELDDPEEACR